MGEINFGLRVLAFFWRVHFRISEPGFWALLSFSLLIGVPTLGAAIPITLICLLGCAIAVQGIARWRITRRRARGRLVIPLFRSASSERAVEVRDTIVKTLQDHLNPDEMKAVYLLPAVVGVADRDFASKLCARLRVYILLQGEIRQESGGSWSVYAATCHRGANIRHIDPHTRDETPAKVRWKWAFANLTGVSNVPQSEYPLEFAHELRAVIQGTAGQVAEYLGDPKRAIRLLDEAIAVAPQSRSPQIDLLHIAQAKALVAAGERDEALRRLRQRYTEGSASAELLRTFAYLLIDPAQKTSEEEAIEAIEVLRTAMGDRADPRRDQTLYNLSQQIIWSPKPADRKEGEELMEELAHSPSHYRDAWYFKRALGAMAWAKYSEELQVGNKNPNRAREAARWYTRAIRARPTVRFFYRRSGRPMEIVTRFIVPPIMFGNAKDAHQEAGHRLRAAWYERRFQRTRSKLIKKGERCLCKARWQRAIAPLDWASSAGRNDFIDAEALALLAIALKEGGRPIETAESVLKRAAEIDLEAVEMTAEIADAIYPIGTLDQS
jgi:tetratricopeptide (TPR) repeat protein